MDLQEKMTFDQMKQLRVFILFICWEGDKALVKRKGKLFSLY